jgi:hypothetical protein
MAGEHSEVLRARAMKLTFLRNFSSHVTSSASLASLSGVQLKLVSSLLLRSIILQPQRKEHVGVPFATLDWSFRAIITIDLEFLGKRNHRKSSNLVRIGHCPGEVIPAHHHDAAIVKDVGGWVPPSYSGVGNLDQVAAVVEGTDAAVFSQAPRLHPEKGRQMFISALQLVEELNQIFKEVSS